MTTSPYMVSCIVQFGDNVRCPNGQMVETTLTHVTCGFQGWPRRDNTRAPSSDLGRKEKEHISLARDNEGICAMSFNSTSPEGLTQSPTASGQSLNNALPGVSATPAPRPAPDTVSSSSSSSSRSCVTCRRRKVRCNKRSPCSNCVKAGIDCVFPPPGRAPRKSKRPPDGELLSRLRRLEGVIEHLSGKNAEVGGSATTSPTQPASSSFDFGAASTVTAPATAATTAPAPTPAPAESKEPNGGCPFGNDDLAKLKPRKFENEFGRLVIEEGRSRYVSNRLWASLGDEVHRLRLYYLL